MSSSFRPGESRSAFGQSSSPFGASFSVAGMPPAGSSQLSSSTWGVSTPGASFGGSLSDSLSQSRPHYTPGYLMSTSQSSASQSASARHDDVPIVQTRAKLNNPLSRNAASDFGMESMFQSSRQRPMLMDEDAPPTTSANDIINEYPSANNSNRRPTFTQKTTRETRSERPRSPPLSQLFYIVVFGYPADRYVATVDYFRSLGENPTEADPHADIINAFRIGYKNPAEAVRAVRKNGEVLGGSWMIGVKWADPAQVESILGSAIVYGSAAGNVSTPTLGSSIPSTGPDMSMDGDVMLSPGSGALVSSTVGTPLKLAPSAAAFRKPGAPQVPPAPGPSGVSTAAPVTPNSGSPSKGVFGQVSDMLFGW